METSKCLALSPIFSTLGGNELLRLSRRSYRMSYQVGDVIFEQGDPGLTLHTIVSGLVKIAMTSEKGGEAVLALLVPGDFFGELSLLDGQPRSAAAIAMEPTETIVLNRDDFLSFLKEHPNAGLSMLSILSSRLRRADGFISDSVFLDIPARVAKKLVELSESFGHPATGGIEIDLLLRQQELASIVGTTRESVNRALSLLEHSGAIKLGRQKITVLSLERLKRATDL